MTLAEMVLNGELVVESVASGEVNRFLDSIAKRLTAAANTTLHDEARFEQAYHAVLNCAWIALRVAGYRASSGQGQHWVLLETLAETLGIGDDEIAFYQELRSLRNQDLYEARPVPSATLQEATSAAEVLTEKLKEWLATHGEP